MSGYRFKMLKGTRIFENQGKITFPGNCFFYSNHFSEGLKLYSHRQIPKVYFHESKPLDYSSAEKLPLPRNIKELASSEKLKFSPQRNRDISGSFISSSTYPFYEEKQLDADSPSDDRVECYDCSGTVSLSSVMQTNVPFPFVSRGKPMHLNMPGGQWGQKEKYVSEDLHNTHHRNSKQFSAGGSFIDRKTIKKNSYMIFPPVVDPVFSNSFSSIFSNVNHIRGYCSDKTKVDTTTNLDNKNSTNVPQLSRKEKLKAAVKDYGAVVIVFHVTISLMSLGCCYAAIVSGIDFTSVFKDLGADEGAATAGNAAQFVVAYAIHKSLAPGRIAITLAAVPFIVKKLRKMGFLKSPQPKPQ